MEGVVTCKRSRSTGCQTDGKGSLGPLVILHCPYLVCSCHGDPPSWLYTTKS